MSMYDSEPISQLRLATSISSNNVFAMVDVLDHTESPSGTTKKVTADTLLAFIIDSTWITVTSGPVILVPGVGYSANGSSLIHFTLPEFSTFGDQFFIEGLGAGLFQINQNVGQSIIFDDSITTVGTTGNILSTTRGDGLTIMCMQDNTVFKVRSFIGTLLTS